MPKRTNAAASGRSVNEPPRWLVYLNEQRRHAAENAPKDEEGNIVIYITE